MQHKLDKCPSLDFKRLDSQLAPSMSGGILFVAWLSNKLELTLVKRIDTLCTRGLITSTSSPPVCLARALPIIFTWATDSAPQPPAP